jgi:HEPN domain-containing protein
MSSPADLGRTLLELARADELAARSLLAIEGIADSIVGFHAQQAVEKALKAALASRGVEFPYTYDLDGLIELARTSGLEVPDELTGVEALSPFAVQVRHGSSGPARLEREQALQWSACAIEWAATVVES